MREVYPRRPQPFPIILVLVVEIARRKVHIADGSYAGERSSQAEEIGEALGGFVGCRGRQEGLGVVRVKDFLRGLGAGGPDYARGGEFRCRGAGEEREETVD